MPSRAQARFRSFSLMEVMVVLLLVSIVAGVSAFSLLPLYRTYRFRTEVDTIYELVRELQLEAMALQSDMKISFKKEGGQWKATSHTNETVLKQQTIDLSYVDQIKMPLQTPLTITLYSNGQIQPKGIISFVYQNETRGLDLTHPPLIKLWIGSPQKWNHPEIPNRDKIKAKLEKEVPK